MDSKKNSIMDMDRQAPCLIDHETYKEILAALLIDEKFIILAEEHLRPEYFLDADMRTMYLRIMSIFKRDGLVNIVNSKEILEGLSYYPITYLNDIMSINVILTESSFVFYCKKIADKYTRRSIYEAGQNMGRYAMDVNIPIEDVLRKLENFQGDMYLREAGEVSSISDIVEMTKGEINDRLKRKSFVGGIPTGFHILDQVIDGLNRSRYIIVSADTSVGKTSFCLNILVKVLMQGHRAAIFSKEMSKTSLCRRMLTIMGNIPDSSIRRGELTKTEYHALKQAEKEIREFDLHIFTEGGLSLPIIRRNVKKLKMLGGIDIVLIDYIQQIRNPDFKGGTENDKLTDISQQLQELAITEDIILITPSQESREGKKAQAQGENRNPLWSLRGSGALENDADVVIALSRDKENRPGSMNWNVCKNRHGKLGKGMLTFDPESQKLSNMEEKK
jgi:replicative DNA helicase